MSKDGEAVRNGFPGELEVRRWNWAVAVYIHAMAFFLQAWFSG